MPAPVTLQKARLKLIRYVKGNPRPQEVGPAMDVQFNPESLKLAYANSMSGGGQGGGSAIQYVSQSTTKLSFELWFDVSAPLPQRTGGADPGTPVRDVRKLSGVVVGFMKPVKADAPAAPAAGAGGDAKADPPSAPPAVRFEWGAFQFDGIIDSLNETIDFFAADGRALRSQLSVSMTQQEISEDLLRGPQPDAGLPSPGINFQTSVKAGDSLQSLAGALGAQDGWQDLALLNDVEDPRNLDPGTLLTLGG